MSGRLEKAWVSTGRTLHRLFWHRWLLVGAIAVVLAGGVVAAAAYGYDRSRSDMIAKGVHVGGINVGGLSRDQARVKLRRAYRVLERPLVLRYRGGRGRMVLTAREAQVRIDVHALVDRALAESHGGWFIPRAWRELTGGRVDAGLRPHVKYSLSAIRSAVDRLERRVNRKPVDARLVPSYDSLRVEGGHRGAAVRVPLLRWQIKHALVFRGVKRVIDVPMHPIEPEATIETLRRDYPSYITIDRGSFTLRVYSHLHLVKSYPIAVGQAGLETPAGVYHIQDKVVDPSWHVPNSAWAGSLAGQVIPPGPSDPLKARWMGIFNGAGIHGTDVTSSIGQAVSHGCVRMLVPDVIDLYDRVSVGTPIYIGN